MKKEVIVRFPPSPTGYLHIGGARTAIFNWLFARKTGGKFILRIEDTDANRSTEASIHGIIEGLKWLGIDWDEGPYFQSRFADDHLQAAQQLLESDFAYKCFCSPMTLEKKREDAKKHKTSFMYDGTCRNLSTKDVNHLEAEATSYTIRLKVPRTEGGVAFKDTVYGDIEKKYADLEDFIIVRSNGQPLYVLSNAVDDIRDGITHVIRGQDHLANTPKQILIYRALGAPIPQFAHMSLTLDPEKTKISKRRHGELVSIQYYRDNGFLPWAMVNFLVHLGWSTTDSREFFSPEELIDAFTLQGISRTNSIFNLQKGDSKFFTDPKALNINAHYLKTLPVEDIAVYVKKQLKTEGIWDPVNDNERRDWFLHTVDLIRDRFQTLRDFVTIGRAFFSDDFHGEPSIIEKHILRHEALNTWLPLLADRISTIEPFSKMTLESAVRELLKESGLKTGVLINGVRVAVTGQAVGPEFLETLLTIGRTAVVNRLRATTALFD